jgi:hypothetical protein
LLNILKGLGKKHDEREKVSIFANGMKKYSHISLSILLSMILLFIGSGVNVIHCLHTGNVKVMTVLDSGMDGMDCGTHPKCMTIEHVELSPTSTAQTVTYDFHVFQPILFILPSLVEEWMKSIESKVSVQLISKVWKSPPRDYLNFIQVLLI